MTDHPWELVDKLHQYNVDIWFSTEGTAPSVEQPRFLDGDLLSARYGIIMAGNDVLLPPGVPAGIPSRGVDFGLDAVAGSRAPEIGSIRFSTEILYEGSLSFTDGDVLDYGTGSVVYANSDLTGGSEPPVQFLGLDALSLNEIPEPESCSKITEIGRIDVNNISPLDGLIAPGMAGSSQVNAPTPFGGDLPVAGKICQGVQQFRVLYREKGTVNWTPMAITTSNWKVTQAKGSSCTSLPWTSTSDGWFSAAAYLDTLNQCGSTAMKYLTVWQTAGKNELYEVVLETQVSNQTFADTVHLVQLDNTAPQTDIEKKTNTTEVLEFRQKKRRLSPCGKPSLVET